MEKDCIWNIVILNSLLAVKSTEYVFSEFFIQIPVYHSEHLHKHRR